ncbi:hypothetical protein ACOSP7_015806 [Xanthoceras sorbifolium]|uniref:Wax synthase domain-containing protein n=1 Tax=Xanthoceras sorbifolium TaxID=99658 RepID=A0ABQ8I7L2_9ROSI|nr:hypothetical protein JRO89_XS04G0281100 [Xanthoceras sorbifolium]
MEGEIRNFIAVWISAFASLSYCFFIGKIIPKGLSRLLAILPVICLFLVLPLNLNSIFLGTPSTFFLVWLANFKLLLFAFGRGPLSSNNNPPLSLPCFFAIACFPIKIHQKTTKNGNKSPHVVNYALQILLLAAFMPVYLNKEHVHPNIMFFLYCFYLYIIMEIIFSTVRDLVWSLIGLELEPQFNKPFLSTSLQDFWGRRWNLMVSDILRQTVYNPVRSISSPLIGTRWATIPAILATFVVSGLMHELLFCYYGRESPRWDLTLFFILHGACMVVEIMVKDALKDKWPRGLPRFLSAPLTVAFVAVTGSWLFIPEMLRCQFDVRARQELAAFMEFVKENVVGTSSAARLDFYLGSIFKQVT